MPTRRHFRYLQCLHWVRVVSVIAQSPDLRHVKCTSSLVYRRKNVYKPSHNITSIFHRLYSLAVITDSCSNHHHHHLSCHQSETNHLDLVFTAAAPSTVDIMICCYSFHCRYNAYRHFVLRVPVASVPHSQSSIFCGRCLIITWP